SGIWPGVKRRVGEKIGGLAVTIAARVAARAAASEVLVSQTVRDLMVGSDLTFIERGSHELKGLPASGDCMPPRSKPGPAAPSRSGRRRDVRIQAEEVVGVVLLLERGQPFIARPIAAANPVLVIVAQIVHVGGPGRERLQGLPEVAGPADMDFGFRRVQ